MALANWFAQYYDASARGSFEAKRSDMRYGATREGVQYIDKNMQPSKEQMTPEEGLHYIARRQGAMRYSDADIDGLFNADGKADLEKECARLEAHPNSIEWRAILSFKKEDLARSGFDSPTALQQLLAEKMPDIGRAHGISPENLVWNAAFHPIDKHGLDHHPHVHVYFYSTDSNEGRMTKKDTLQGFEKTRSMMVNTMFSEEMQNVQLLGREARQALRKGMTLLQSDPSWLEDSRAMASLMYLKEQLPTSGKMQYGYLPAASKKTVDNTLREFVKSPILQNAYEQLEAAQRQYVEAYNTDEAKIEQRMQDWRKHFFHPTGKGDKAVLHNTIIRMAMGLQEEIPMTVDTMPEHFETTPESTISTNTYIAQLADKAAAGSGEAMYRLGCLLQRSEPNKAAALFEVASQKGIMGAIEKVALAAEQNKDYDRAIRLYEQAATGGNDTAMYRLGKLYENGAGKLLPNADIAQMWFEKAASQGNLWAGVRLSTKYEYSEYRQDAILGLEQTIQNAPKEDLFLHRQLGELYEKDNDYLSAIYEYATAKNMPECTAALVRMAHDDTVCRSLADIAVVDSDAADAAMKILDMARGWESDANSAKHEVFKTVQQHPEMFHSISSIDAGEKWHNLTVEQQAAVSELAKGITSPSTPYMEHQVQNAILYAYTQQRLQEPLQTQSQIRAAFADATAELRYCIANHDTTSPKYKAALQQAVEKTKHLHPSFHSVSKNNPKQFERFVEQQAEKKYLQQKNQQKNQQKFKANMRLLASTLLSMAIIVAQNKKEEKEKQPEVATQKQRQNIRTTQQRKKQRKQSDEETQNTQNPSGYTPEI